MTDQAGLVSPDAVRVWRGWRLQKTSDGQPIPIDQFYSKLGNVFVPATVLMQIDAGLYSYTPTVPGGLPGKPDPVPDETAILFWESPETYWNGFNKLAVRTYTLTHGGVYTPQSRADLPTLFSGTLLPDKPVYLFDKKADWMHGTIHHLVAGRAPQVDPQAFQTAIAGVLAAIQKQGQLDGAIACIGSDYLVYWELRPTNVGTPTPPTGIEALQKVITGWSQSFVPAPTFLPIGLWDTWAGMDVRAGSSFNMVFKRAGEA